MTAGMVLTALGLAIAFALPVVDPLLLTLNLSKISRGLNIPTTQVGLLASVATLVAAAAVLAVGNLGDTYGLKRLLIYGLLANVVVGLLAAMSPNYAFLLVMRVLDGFALTALAGLSLALLTVSVPPRIRPVAIGIFMATDAILFGVSPLVGGWLVGVLGWRGLFVVSPVLALVALVLTARYVSESPRQPAHGFDLVGVGLFGVALLGVIYGVSAAQNGLTAPQAWIPLLGAALALAAFVRHERRVENPALELALFARSAFVVAVLVVLIINVLCAGFSVWQTRPANC
ncbi:MAG: MFS transporter [Candidatus Sericytochromatia bacterium]